MKNSTILRTFLSVSITFFLILGCTETKDLLPSSSVDENLINYSSERISSTDFTNLIKKNVDNANQKTDIEIVKGIVHFKNFKVYDEFMTNFKLSKTKFLEAFKTFESKEVKYNQLLKKVNVVESEMQLRDLLKEYTSEIEIIDDRVIAKGGATPFDFLLSSVEKPLFYVGNIIYMYNSSGQYIIVDGDLGSVEKIGRGEQSLKNVIANNYGKLSTKNIRTTNASCTDMYGFWKRPDKDRRGTSTCKIYPNWAPTGGTISGEPEFKVRWQIDAEGYVEKKYWFIWMGYPSNNELVISYKANAIFNGSIIGSFEPYYSEFASGYRIYNTELLYTGINGLFIPQSQLPLLSSSLEERSGHLFNWELGGAAVFYRCN